MTLRGLTPTMWKALALSETAEEIASVHCSACEGPRGALHRLQLELVRVLGRDRFYELRTESGRPVLEAEQDNSLGRELGLDLVDGTWTLGIGSSSSAGPPVPAAAAAVEAPPAVSRAHHQELGPLSRGPGASFKAKLDEIATLPPPNQPEALERLKALAMDAFIEGVSGAAEIVDQCDHLLQKSRPE